MYLREPLDKAVHFGPAPKARGKRIRRISRNLGNLRTIVLAICSCIERAKSWNKLTPTERITLELKWTDLMLELLRIGNTKLMHSLRYRLREQSIEEDELEWGRV